jgi:hypothetical protein
MYIENDTIHFKSDEPYYIKEKSGIKKNTVRYIPINEIAEKIIPVGMHNIINICITNSMTKESFTRKLTDISTMNIKTGISIVFYIFSWA